jgi:hypothetical protein
LVRALILPPSAASTAFKCVQFENYIEWNSWHKLTMLLSRS